MALAGSRGGGPGQAWADGHLARVKLVWSAWRHGKRQQSDRICPFRHCPLFVIAPSSSLRGALATRQPRAARQNMGPCCPGLPRRSRLAMTGPLRTEAGRAKCDRPGNGSVLACVAAIRQPIVPVRASSEHSTNPAPHRWRETWKPAPGTALDTKILDLVATVIESCEEPCEPAPGHPGTR